MIYDYELVRSKRKTIAIQIKPGGKICVRVPMKTSNKAADELVRKNSAWIENALKKQLEHDELHPQPTADDIAALREKARKIIPQRVEYFSNLTGLIPTSLKITSARTRFGSCSGRNGICISLYLMQYPPEAVDYVVLHELAHIKHHNHSARFYSLIEQYMPDYRQRIELLKK